MYIWTWSRQKTSRLTELFLFYRSAPVFIRGLNFALVRSRTGFCHICSYGWPVLGSVGLLLHPSRSHPAHAVVHDVYWENSKKGGIVWFSSFPFWTKRCKRKAQASVNLVNLPWIHPFSPRMTCPNMVLQKKVRRTDIQMFKFLYYLFTASSELDQKVPREIVSSRPVVKALSINVLWRENDKDGSMCSGETFLFCSFWTEVKWRSWAGARQRDEWVRRDA